MASIVLQNVAKSFGDTAILRGIDLSIAHGEFVVFVGPSGCGKSTLLRIIAGLEGATSGTILMDGADATTMRPIDRGVAMVFQNYALYPHMTVAENIGFGLRIAKTPKNERIAAVSKAAEALRLTPYLHRKPAALSGGQRQRVAIGRAIVKQPKVFLFDEPLSNLDADLRGEMRLEIGRLHRELDTTMIYVTHDQVEAMTLADRIVVLRDGRIEQVGTPSELYGSPNNLFVARFLGSPRINLFENTVARSASNGMMLNIPVLGEVPMAGDMNLDPDIISQRLTIGVRAHNLKFGEPTQTNVADVVQVENLGDVVHVHMKIPDGGRVVSSTSRSTIPRIGDRLGLFIDPAHLLCFGPDGARLR